MQKKQLVKLKNLTAIHDKTSSKLRLGEIFLNQIKSIYKKPTRNTIFNGETLKDFLLRSGLCRHVDTV